MNFNDVTFFFGSQNFFSVPKKKVRPQKKSTLNFTIASDLCISSAAAIGGGAMGLEGDLEVPRGVGGGATL